MVYLYWIKDKFKGVFISLLHTLCIVLPLFLIGSIQTWILWLVFVLCTISSIVLLFLHPKEVFDRKFLRLLYQGSESLKIFIYSTVTTILFFVLFYMVKHPSTPWLIWSIIWIFLMEAILFWNGMIKVYLSSVQLGIKTRIIAMLCGWIPIVNIIYLFKIIKRIDAEIEFESHKDNLGEQDILSQECITKYPILFVHGIFFRDIKYVNYWGRIPRYLMQRGSTVYYGEQESSQSVAVCGEQLSIRIKEIVEQSGFEKVNIIAHSKGGLDSRYAISNFGMDKYVASLTTINTPHKGCIFANYLLKKAPKSLLRQVSNGYNKTFALLGDEYPDFLAGVSDLSDEACEVLNEKMPNMDNVYYQSFGSYVNKASSGKFPLNLSYPVVKHFDGRNDGLVSVESAMYFENSTIVSPKGKRGITHADIIDLNKENIEGFDVREFYRDIIVDLKKRGY